MPPIRRIDGFLADADRQRWLEAAQSSQLSSRWVPGRQGSGYEKLDLLAALSEDAFGAERSFVQAQIEEARDRLGVDPSRGWDAYLLRYQAGAFVPEHRDPTDTLCHLRLNALLQAASSGTGLLHLDGELCELRAGDAVLFRPDVHPHRVTRVEGERLVLSVGCVFEARAGGFRG